MNARRGPAAAENTAPSCRASSVGIAERRQQHLLDELMRQLAAAAVRQQHGRVVGDGDGAGEGVKSVIQSILLSMPSSDSGNTPRTRPSDDTIGAPSGCSGVQRVPKAGHWSGFLTPCRISPPMHSVDSSTVWSARPKRRSASNAAYGSRSPQPLAGMSPMPRHLRGDDLEHLADQLLRLAGCPRAGPAARTGSRPRRGPPRAA